MCPYVAPFLATAMHLSKIAHFNPPLLYVAPSLGVTHSNFTNILCIRILQCLPKKEDAKLLAVALSSLNRFLKLFHYRFVEIVINDPWTPQTCRYTFVK